MARIKNVELPKTKSLFVGLTAIHGIGQSTGKKICEAAGLDPDMKVQDLTLDQEALIRTEVDKYLVEGDLRREVQMNIKNKMEINSYQGTRHVDILDDDWTIVTKDGRPSAHFEHTVVVTEDGYEILTGE